MHKTKFRLPSFGGGWLAGDQWVRILYLDESGIGSVRKDPVLVVAGIIIHADSQYGSVANALQNIIDKRTPIGVPKPKFLHAVDIFHGSGEFDRRHWPLEVRQEILYDLSDVIIDFDLPLVWSASDRNATFSEDPDKSYLHSVDHVRDIYSTCVLSCMFQAEFYMRQLENMGEICSVILEQNQELQKRLPELLDFMKVAEKSDGLDDEVWDFIPFTRIMDNPAAQPKSGSSILQLADYCAFAIKMGMRKGPKKLNVAHGLQKQMLRVSNADPNDFRSLWNPKFLPRIWGGTKFDLQFVEGKLELIDLSKR